ncbi:MAG: hypothetical protein DME91_02630 [Verrucomicrobia bacterium]|nr:MAG: hypothetical protein DME91_02630 [Verrucomicrobiota bacterium]
MPWAAAERLIAWVSDRSYSRVFALVHGRAFRGLVGVFYFRPDSFPETATAGCRLPRGARPHLDAFGVLRCLNRGCAPTRVRDSALGKAREPVSARQRRAGCPRGRAAAQLQLSFARSRRPIWPARCQFPVIAELSSKDVIHDFFLPSMRIAGDAIPGSLIPIWFTPIKTGTYEVICGQLCGLGHYGMKGTLVVDTPQDYQAWLKERAELAGGAQGASSPSAPQPQSSPGAPQQPQSKPAAPAASPTPQL